MIGLIYLGDECSPSRIVSAWESDSLRARLVTVPTSFIRQRNSWSLLTLTSEFFEHLLCECEIFPLFKGFVLCFGRKNGENDIGHPQLKFRPILNGSPRGGILRFGKVHIHYSHFIRSHLLMLLVLSKLTLMTRTFLADKHRTCLWC